MLPNDGRTTAWPPVEYAPALAKMRTHVALWQGDRERLAKQDGYPASAVHVPLPQDIAEASADLIFGDPPTARVPGDDDNQERQTQQQLVDDVYNTPTMVSTLLEGAEIASVYGGVFFRVGWDIINANRPIVTVTDPDTAIPVFKHGRLTSVTFWTEYTRNKHVYRLLEEHTPGRIEYALFESRGNMLGQRVPLTEIPEGDQLAQIVDSASGINTGTERVTAIYVPNILPNRAWRTGPLRNYGRSDFDGVEHLFTQVDTVFGSWMRDIRLARARILAEISMVTPSRNGTGATFDDDQEVFVTYEHGEQPPLTPVQFAIRVNEHEQTLRAVVQIVLRRAGLSESSFGAAEGLETATGVKAKERMTDRTRDKKIVFWREALADLIMVMCDLNSHLYGAPRLTVRPDVRFPVEAQMDVASLANTLGVLNAARSMSTMERVRQLHPDWDSDTVDDEVNRIYRENGIGPAGDPMMTER